MSEALVLIRHITIDCADPYGLAEFWGRVTGWPMGEGDEPGDPEVLLESSEGPGLLFIRVPEGKSAKNRLHLDLQPRRRTRDEQVEWLVGIGAKVFDDQRRPDGAGWVTMTDPEGNEFCVERSAQERASG
ncbi:VOC family protein [Allokutzneria sp. NRRL B-24872]|uniref:VOC family protein n=1 Tax=Allokutzneria sp. NRRL B-24872 TaxID=1137961 RepID=UPI000A387F03|nr:VOC family protein [Allokutzneria sp. NRRL B-24872]